ncbi:TPA_exp: Uncharacterized protein A8136_2734 [Trichophyton benhamiae CBS 112371]|uniref:Uncharacterized protein n=1 Tax=Arthroderma benhamiae (strain ATCC MYA-4681 / CBS 112371) TaxID=663331 RepID=D4AL80_ARTBC|nr:uncharacterized protein ARB_05077 [Trichophyton benhamiae CBS 112371]EFE36139.1 hypothetical protein ARB_05077 [Trichophyton benhamiae CBS 112371]DAA78949.1 TPA_exp: Uncharacterized protein A8136_2734 [Trichophyton benhamiae CBS 112371]
MSPWTGSKLLVGLPKGTPRIKYINMRELESAIKSRASECYEDGCKGTFLVVTAIPSTFITEADEFYGDRSPRFAINIDESLAVIETMLPKPHEILAQNLVIHVGSAIDQMGLRRVYNPSGAANMNSPNRANITSTKQPDGSFFIEREQWPTLIIEIGLSESIRKMAMDAHWWLEAEGSCTLIVITAKIDREKPLITFQRWEHHHPPHRPITRRCYPNSAVVQEVRAVHENGVTRVTGNIILPFEKMLRRCKETKKEKDIVIERDVLIDFAEATWKSQQFM